MAKPRKGLLGYYRQFEGMSPEESSMRIQERRREERSQELARVDDLDMATPSWHEPPDPEIVNAATFALRRSINRYPPAGAGPAVAAIARHHGVPEARIALGHGAGQLLQAALRELAAGGEVVVVWPGWAPMPALVARADARPVPVADLEAVPGAVTEATRAVVLSSPNDPTGALTDHGALRALAESLPPQVTVIVDEALVDLAGEEASVVPLLDDLPNLLILRSFSKGWAMAGLRVGYVLGSAADAELMGALTPGQGVASPAQAGVAAALEDPDRSARRMAVRRATATAERERLIEGLAGTRFSLTGESAVHLAWLRGEDMTAAQIVHGLAGRRIHVASGAAWDDEQHVRITLRDRKATERLLSALVQL